MRSGVSRLLAMAVLCFAMPEAEAQGPLRKYFYEAATELSWASCYVYQGGGSRQRIPFLPVIGPDRSPCGTNNYSRDVAVDADIAFVGSGLAVEGLIDCYAGVDVQDAAVMFCYDLMQSTRPLSEAPGWPERITEAVSHGAGAVILFSRDDGYPYLRVSDVSTRLLADIPVITVTKESARRILASAGRDLDAIIESLEGRGETASEVLISRLKLRIEGAFEHVETGHFLCRYRKDVLPKAEAWAESNEKSVGFLLNLFQPEPLEWPKTSTTLFRDFDSKYFYTGHLGSGLSSRAGVFIVSQAETPEYGLLVHENAHTLIGANWPGSTSFMNEGIGMYAEAQATGLAKNHQTALKLKGQGKGYGLSELLDFNIGGDPHEKTRFAYPAVGSFVHYLIDAYSLADFKRAHRLEGRSREEKAREDTWKNVFEKSITELELQWLAWLQEEYGGGESE